MLIIVETEANRLYAQKVEIQCFIKAAGLLSRSLSRRSPDSSRAMLWFMCGESDC